MSLERVHDEVSNLERKFISWAGLADLAASLKLAKADRFVDLQTITVTRYDADAGDWQT
jgi:hypothetical protein